MIEILLMFWVLYRYWRTMLVKLVAAIMLFLAIFQAAEYNICEAAWGIDSLTWARIGFVAITTLPALGIHAMLVIAQRPWRYNMTIIYSVMAGFALYFATASQGISASVCGGNYVIFESSPHMMWWYALYYYGLEIVGLLLAWDYARSSKNAHTKKALYGFAAAYLVLLVPTTTVNVMYPETLAGIPSIMCGFAVFLALIIALYVLPHAQLSETSATQKRSR